MSEEQNGNGNTTATPDADGGGEQPDRTRTFSQSELDAIINDRLERERKKFSDYDTIKSELDKLKADADKKRKAEMSEIEKLQTELEEAQTERQNAVARVMEITTRTAIEREAAKAGFHDPSDAYALLDWDEFEVQDDGTVKGVEDAVEELAKAKPHLVKNASLPDIDGQKRGKQTKKEADEERIARAAQRYGVRYTS